MAKHGPLHLYATRAGCNFGFKEPDGSDAGQRGCLNSLGQQTRPGWSPRGRRAATPPARGNGLLRSLFLALSLCTCFRHHQRGCNCSRAKGKEFFSTLCGHRPERGGCGLVLLHHGPKHQRTGLALVSPGRNSPC